MSAPNEPETTQSLAAALPAHLAGTSEPSAPAPTPLDPDALEAERERLSRELVRAARRADNQRRWAEACPHDLQVSDWSYPDTRIANNRSRIEKILGYTLGAKGILASGPTGRGKSRAMWQLMRRLGDEGHDVRLYAASDWFDQLQSNLKYGRDDARGWVEAVAKRAVVFIDDLGQQALTTSREDWAQAWFFRFLDIRVGEKLPLFVTTNLGADAIAQTHGNLRGDPLVRRLLDVCEPIRFEA